MKRVAFYLRCSAASQDTLLQRDRLTEVAERSGWNVVHIYEDAGISGAKGRDGRPQFDQMLSDARKRKFDVLCVWALDRLSRSVSDLVNTVKELEGFNVDLYVDQQNLDTTTPAGRLLFHIIAAIGQFEREILISRVKAGIQKARIHGTRSGKRLGNQKTLRPYQVREIEHSLFTEKLSLNECITKHGVSRNTIVAIREGKHALSSSQSVSQG